MRVQMAENVNKALEFITSRGVKLTNIGPEGMLSIAIWMPLSLLVAFCLRTSTNLTSTTHRYYRWKPQAHPWDDMDSYLTFYDRGYQVCLPI